MAERLYRAVPPAKLPDQNELGKGKKIMMGQSLAKARQIGAPGLMKSRGCIR
jgi:hypothetical protein